MHPLLDQVLLTPQVDAAEATWGAIFKQRESAPSEATATQPGRGYILCLTPRSGSTWLATLLGKSGQLGHPREYFNPDWPLPDCHATDFAGYVRDVKVGSATPNGIFGVKADFGQMAPFMRHNLFADPHGEYRYIYLTREDVVLQGISLYKATMTGIWSSRREGVSPPSFEPGQIWKHVSKIITMMSSWERAFAAYGIVPLRITYEQLEEDPRAAVARVAEVLGVTLDASALTLEVPLKRQRTAEDLKWASMLTDETDYSSVARSTNSSSGTATYSSTGSAATTTESQVQHESFPIESNAAQTAEIERLRAALRQQRAETTRIRVEWTRQRKMTASIRHELDGITNSTSWRMTGPLRSVGSRVPPSMRKRLMPLIKLLGGG